MYKNCPYCGTPNDILEISIGQKVKCKKCGAAFDSDETSQQRTVISDKSTPPAEHKTKIVTFTPKHNIPGYEILQEIGKGGMGYIYKARQISLQRTVAIKILPEELSQDENFLQRFDKEALVLAGLKHPNITAVYDKGHFGNVYYFVMEFIEGFDLRKELQKGRLPLKETLRIITAVCGALEYAHQKGVVHRDIKPENILFDFDRNLKIADFGLAGLATVGSNLNITGANVVMGTYNYMSPEQRQSANVDGRSDIYSTGVMFYEMLTGQLPVGRFSLPSEIIPGIDKRIDKIITGMLQTDLRLRYQTIKKVISDLSEVLSVKPVVEKKEGKKIPIKPFAITLIILAVVVSLIADLKKLTVKKTAQQLIDSAMRTDKPDEKIKIFKKAREEFPDDKSAGAKSLILEGNVYTALGKNSEAISSYEKVIAEYPEQNDETGFAQIFAAAVLNKTGDTDQALEVLKNCISNHPDNSEIQAMAYLGVGDIQTALGDTRKARIAYQKVLQDFPSVEKAVKLAKEKLEIIQ